MRDCRSRANSLPTSIGWFMNSRCHYERAPLKLTSFHLSFLDSWCKSEEERNEVVQKAFYCSARNAPQLFIRRNLTRRASDCEFLKAKSNCESIHQSWIGNHFSSEKHFSSIFHNFTAVYIETIFSFGWRSTCERSRARGPCYDIN